MRYSLSFLLVIYCGLCFSQDLKKYQRLDSLVDIYFRSDLNKAFTFQKEALDEALSLQDRAKTLFSYRSLASIEIELGEFQTAEVHLDEAITYAETRLDTIGVFRKKGILYEELGDTDKAIFYLLQCLELVGEENTKLKRKVLNDLGLFYRNVQEPEKALAYFKKKAALEVQAGGASAERSYMNIGLIFLDQNLYDSAIYYFNQSYAQMDQEKDQFGLSLYYNNMGSALSDDNRFEEALPYALKSIEIKKRLGNKQSLANTYNLLSFIYLGLKEFGSAENYASLSLSLQDSAAINRVKYNSLRYLIQARLSQADTTQVSELVQYLINVNRERYEQEKTAKFTEMATKYEVKEKENDLLQANLELEKATGDIQRQTIFRNSLIFGLIIVTLITLLVFRNQRLKAKANKLLARKNAEIEELNEAKTRWFVNVSHELRTPLTLVKGPIDQVVAGDKLNPTVRHDLDLAQKNLGILETLVNEILDLSKMESGKVTLKSKAIDLTILLRQCFAAFDSLAKQLKITLHLDLEQDLWVKVDPDKMYKVVTNLLSNALKFTHEGGKVTLGLHCDEQLIKIMVSDTGEGISKEDINHVFDRFYQSSLEKKSRQGGTGIGLALSKEIVNLHEGEISVKSQQGEGSQFVVTLPASLRVNEFEVMEPPVIESPTEIEELIVFSGFEEGKPKLLLVDDNRDMRSFIAGFMKSDYRITEARDGMEALEKLAQDAPDIILTDIMMPRMDGIEFIKRLKSHEEWKKIPLISLTALARESDKIYTLQIGVDDYLVKPFNPQELKVRAFNLINNSIQRRNSVEEGEETLSYQDELVQKLRKEVERNLSESSFNVGRLADVAAMSERQLHRTVKQICGFTPGQFVREIRLQKAMSFIEHGKFATLSELSHAVGFEHPGYFSTVFEKRFGDKPTAYMQHL